MALDAKFRFDDKTYRHYTNDFLAVMHCHHYMSLLTALAQKYDDIGGTRILVESCEDSIRPILESYISDNRVIDPNDRLAVGSDYYALMGMGLMSATGDALGGSVELVHSHVDEGWILKWGKAQQPLNYWTQGYISAMFGAAFDKPARSYKVEEIAALVKGDPASLFTVSAV